MIIFVILALLKHSLHAQKSCHEFTEQFNCNTNSNDACRWIIGDCRCISDVKLDILFGIDTSDSIGKEAFQIEKQFISNLVTQDINNRTRIGFTMFSTDTNNSRTIDYWETYDLQNYISGLHYTGGWANTRQLISDALIIFSNTKQYDRQQILIMITNSNPPQSVCDIAASVKQQGIRVIIIGAADALNKPSVECLCQQSEDFIPVASFSDSDFESIMGSLSNVLCPISKECKITEVNAMKKPSIWNTEGDGRYTRFIEIYNTGIDFNANTLSLSGLVNMVRGPDIIIPQGTYVVFYDAADLPSPSIPSCHLCGSDCDLSNCAISGNTMTTSYCWCSNTIYIACGNSNDICPATNSSPSINAINGCDICTFNDSMTKTNWNVRLNDVSASGAIIDEVIYGNEAFWITTDDKYSYELISKGFDNSYGNNWAQSCNPLGTPCADALVTCDTMCIDNNSCGGNNECLGNGNCNCDINTGYYPQCIDATSCTKCLLVPSVNNCQILWTKNSTDTYAIFIVNHVKGAQYYKNNNKKNSDDDDNDDDKLPILPTLTNMPTQALSTAIEIPKNNNNNKINYFDDFYIYSTTNINKEIDNDSINDNNNNNNNTNTIIDQLALISY